jgi:16S rRNA (cytosine967-C5)-methyltransferase
MNRKNVFASQNDSKVFDENYKGLFDAVLCDAPCSGVGVINDNPDIKLNRTQEDVFELNKEQISILKNVSKYVKKGGYLYYSTCSIVKDENIGVVTKFLKENKDFTSVDIDSKLDGLKLDIGIQFLPDISMGAGFYFAKLKKN